VFAGNHHSAMVGNWDSPVGMVDWDPCNLSLDSYRVEQFHVADKQLEISKQSMQSLLRRVSWIDSFALSDDTNMLSGFVSAADCGGENLQNYTQNRLVALLAYSQPPWF